MTTPRKLTSKIRRATYKANSYNSSSPKHIPRLTLHSISERSKNSLISSSRKSSNLAHNLSRRFNTIIPGKNLKRKTTIKFPIPGDLATKVFGNILNPFELLELKNYKKIYYIGNLSCFERKETYENEDGSYIVVSGDQIKYRYEIIDLIEETALGKVCKVFDHKSKQEMALKIYNRSPLSNKKSSLEITIFETLANIPNFSQMKAHFVFRNHVCICSELLGTTLEDLVKTSSLHILLTKHIITNTLKALSQLKTLNILHCDIKPRNILVDNSKESTIKITNFEASFFKHTNNFGLRNSKRYKAPEDLLGLGYSEAIDIWGLGCTAYEAVEKKPLFQSDNDLEILESMVQYLGLPPKHILKNGQNRDLFRKLKHLAHKKILLKKYRKSQPHFVDFVQKCLQWDPRRRIKPEEALEHQWLNIRHRMEVINL